MNRRLAALLVAWAAAAIACGGSGVAPSSLSPAGGDPTLGFNGLTANGAPVTSYTEAGFTVAPIAADWTAVTTYGSPAPFIEFTAAAGTTVTGQVEVTTGGALFYFKSVDVYSSTTPIPYTLTGLKAGALQFTVTGTLGNTFGAFRTVQSSHASDAVDTLRIALTNSAAACCRNPMGLDNIVVSTTSLPSARSFSLTGAVGDRASGTAISGATVAILSGLDAGQTTKTDAAGRYTFPALNAGSFNVSAAAAGYVSQTAAVTLDSNQTFSFQLSQQPKPAAPSLPAGATVISFAGLTTNGAAMGTYTESGFVVTTASGAWSAVTSYGNPAPFIEFASPAGATSSGEVRVTAAGTTFGFYSVDLYSSTTPIPYTLTGLRGGSVVFTLANKLPNTFGAFATVTNPNAAGAIDTLSIALTNPSAACCPNPMGLDTIVLTR